MAKSPQEIVFLSQCAKQQIIFQSLCAGPLWKSYCARKFNWSKGALKYCKPRTNKRNPVDDQVTLKKRIVFCS